MSHASGLLCYAVCAGIAPEWKITLRSLNDRPKTYSQISMTDKPTSIQGLSTGVTKGQQELESVYRLLRVWRCLPRVRGPRRRLTKARCASGVRRVIRRHPCCHLRSERHNSVPR